MKTESDKTDETKVKGAHSPTPWHAESDDVRIRKNGFEPLVCRCLGETEEQAESNAVHIVRCVNEREGLVEALEKAREILNTLDGYPVKQGYVDSSCLEREDSKDVELALLAVNEALATLKEVSAS